MGERPIILGAVSLIIVAFLTLLFGIHGGLFGLLVLIGIIGPFYFILSHFGIEDDLAALFAFFLGIGLSTTLSYYLGYALPSLWWSFVAVVVVLYAVAAYLWIQSGKKPGVEMFGFRSE